MTGFPYACWGIQEPECRTAVAAALRAIGGPQGTVAYAAVERAEQNDFRVTVESRDGETTRVRLALGMGMPAAPVERLGIATATARSGRAAHGVALRFDLGHCGFHSPIDVDGSFWDVVGYIDTGAPETINQASVEMVISEPDRAVLTTERLRLELARRHGPKFFPPCM